MVVDSISRQGNIGGCRNDCEILSVRDEKGRARHQAKGSMAASGINMRFIISPTGSGYRISVGFSLSLMASCIERVLGLDL